MENTSRYTVRKIESDHQQWDCFEVVDREGKVIAKTGQNETWCSVPIIPEIVAWRIAHLIEAFQGVKSGDLENILARIRRGQYIRSKSPNPRDRIDSLTHEELKSVARELVENIAEYRVCGSHGAEDEMGRILCDLGYAVETHPGIYSYYLTAEQMSGDRVTVPPMENPQ
jgi:hypothetical protein